MVIITKIKELYDGANDKKSPAADEINEAMPS